MSAAQVCVWEVTVTTREVQKWHYNTHDVIVRIPLLVGEVWELGYGKPLQKFQCIEITSFFNGMHMGTGFSSEIFLAKDENDSYLLVKAKRYVTE